MKKSTLTFATIAGIFALCAFGGSWYALSSIGTMREKLSLGHIDLQKEEERAAMILDVKRQLKRLEAERAELGQYFFKEEDIVKHLEQLEDLARHAGIDMTVNSAGAIDRKGKAVFQTGMKIEGTWQEVMYFIELLESLPLRTELTRVNLVGSESGERWTGEVSMDLLSFIPNKKTR